MEQNLYKTKLENNNKPIDFSLDLIDKQQLYTFSRTKKD
jgi:hypothetical protein